jgi:hypothetical protein
VNAHSGAPPISRHVNASSDRLERLRSPIYETGKAFEGGGGRPGQALVDELLLFERGQLGRNVGETDNFPLSALLL